jgi:hypothetical protein
MEKGEVSQEPEHFHRRENSTWSSLQWGPVEGMSHNPFVKSHTLSAEKVFKQAFWFFMPEQVTRIRELWALLELIQKK